MLSSPWLDRLHARGTSDARREACQDEALVNLAFKAPVAKGATALEGEEGKCSPAARNHWAGADFRVSYRFEGQTFVHTPAKTLLSSKFGFWLDRTIANKTKFRRSLNLQTPYEETRMGAKPKQVDALVRAQKKALIEQETKHKESLSKGLDKEEMKNRITHGVRKTSESLVDETGTLTPRMCYQDRLADGSLRNLLEKVFDAADEEKAGLLQHRDVAELLFACPLSLTRWEFVQLLSAAQEQPGGWIQYKPFLAKIPPLLDILRDRREKLQHRQARRRVTVDAVLQLYREEIDETFRCTRCILTNVSQCAFRAGLVKREELQAAMQRSDRFSRQDAAFVMQTIPSNDKGEAEFEALPTLLQVLRRESVNNSVLEVDGDAIEKELCRSIADMGITAGGAVPVWTLREVVENSGLWLSRMHIHVFMCLASMNRQGQVDWKEFIEMVREVLPPLFNSDSLMETAEQISRLTADAEEQAELEELQGFSGAKAKQRQRPSIGGRGRSKLREVSQMQQRQADDSEQVDAPDRESVEKALIHLFTVLDDRRKGSVPIQMFVGVMHYWSNRAAGGDAAGETGNISPPALAASAAGGASFAAERRYADIVSSCQLTQQEVTGFVAEAKIDSRSQEIKYSEHIKAWVGIIFEIRRSQLLYNIIHNSHQSDNTRVK
ncbi:hypothetical protein Esti_005396 [Eimeria stiedai]